jgi:RimJ/RimL family protein N-acetyltransferase
VTDLSTWTARPLPDGRTLDGRLVRLERLSAERHGADLGAVLSGPGTESLYDYLGDPPPATADEVIAWARRMETVADPFFYAIIDKATGKAIGRFSLMRPDAANGVIEVGHVLYSPPLAKGAGATEAQYLLARHVFDDLGYRRYEWKCNNLNEPSKRAGQRLGFTFEGVFRQHMIVKGRNRDTAWFAMLDSEWPARRAAFEAWLAPSNFDAEGRQKTKLGAAA